MKNRCQQIKNKAAACLFAVSFVAISAGIIHIHGISVQAKEAETSVSTTISSQEKILDQKVEKWMSNHTLEEKVAQLFIITPEALTGYEKVTAAQDASKTALKSYPVGGLIYFNQNLQSPAQVRKMLANMQKFSQDIAGIPLFTCVDEEGGTVARVGNNPSFETEKIENMAEVGASKNVERAYEIGQTMGGYLSDLGFNLDFAPSADVLTNKQNTVVAKRSFGSDPELVSHMALEVSRGLEEKNVLPVLKHYPGHGASKEDTHKGYAYLEKTLDEIMKEELLPFLKGIKNGSPIIMAAHISAPKITGDNTPSTLSYTMITEILRKKLGFQGIIVTDALNMGAIQAEYSSSEAAVKAIQAGVDLLLMPTDFKAAYEGILKAINNGDIEESRIDESLKRILKVKYSMRH